MAVVVLNRTASPIGFALRVGGRGVATELPPHAIATYRVPSSGTPRAR